MCSTHPTHLAASPGPGFRPLLPFHFQRSSEAVYGRIVQALALVKLAWACPQSVLPQSILIVCRPSYPPLTRPSREACPQPRSGNGNLPRTRLSPRSLSPAPIGERESIPPLTRPSREACPQPRSGNGNLPRTRLSPRSLSPAPIGELESIPPLNRLSRESGNPYVLDVGLPLDKPKVHWKTAVVAITKRPPVLNSRHLALAPSGDHSLRC